MKSRLAAFALAFALATSFTCLVFSQGTLAAEEEPIPGYDGSTVPLSQAVAEFQAWFEKGYKGPTKVRLGVAGDGMRLGVFATEPIAAESLYLSIPTEIIIGEETIFATPLIGPVLKSHQKDFGILQPSHATLALFLLYEKYVKGENSFWKSYIALLPETHDTPEFYTDEELALLKGTLIPGRVERARAERMDEYEWLRTNLFSYHPILFPGDIFLEERFAWAMGILNTRMIWWDGKPHLVPMLDMINCRQGPNPRRVHSTRGVGKRANTFAPWRFETGDQIFENYGQPNPTYFLYHGFVMQPNVHDCATIQLTEHMRDSRRHVLRRWGLLREEHCISPEKLDEALVVARVIASGDKELRAMDGPPRTRISAHNERRALKHLLNHVGAYVKQFLPIDPTWNAVPNPRPFRERMAVTYRETQRSLLRQTEMRLKAMLSRIRNTGSPDVSSTIERDDL